MLKLFTKTLLGLPYWLWIMLVLAILLRIPSLFEPFAYGDEMIYLTLGEGIRRGLLLYRDVFDHKTPFLYYMAAIAGNVFWFRFILGLWMVATTVLYYKLILYLFPSNSKLRFYSLLIFVILTTIPLWEGQTSNAELFLMGPVVAGLLSIRVLLRKQLVSIRWWHIALSGVLFSTATLFKVPALFESGIVIYMALVAYTSRGLSIRKLLYFSAIWITAFATPILLSVVWFWSRGILSDYLYGGLLINFGYISAFRPGDAQEPFLVKNAPLIIRGLIVFIGLCIIYLKRTRLSRSFVFLSAWLLFALFATTLSERPYPHYLIQLVPPIAGLIGMLLAAKTKEQVYTILPLSLAFFAISYFNFWYYHSGPYYQRFIRYATGITTQEQYHAEIDNHINRNYAISDYIQTRTESSDPIFVWGDFSNVYAISRRLPPLRYLTSFHINDFYSQEKAIRDLENKPPKIVVVQPDAPEFPMLRAFLNSYDYRISRIIDGATIWEQ